jgi:hypothetical protein
VPTAADVEKADRIGRSRARLFAAQGVLFVAWQGLFFLNGPDAPARLVDGVRIWAWLLWVAALLALLATGGGLLRARGVRRLLNDELTRRNRLHAYAAGFWAACAGAILLFVVNLYEPVGGREAIHIPLSAAIGAALIAFALRERRSAGSG